MISKTGFAKSSLFFKPSLTSASYLNSSNFFLEDSQTKYLNALLDNVGKKLRSKNA